MKAGKKQKAKPQRTGRAVSGGTARLTQAAPASAAGQDLKANASERVNGSGGSGILRPDGEGRLPGALVEAGGSEPRGLLPGRFMSFVTILAVVFISIIAWFVSQMPNK